MGLKLRKDDRLVAGAAFEPGEDVHVVIVSQAGFMKRVALAEFPVQGRGGQGVQSLETTKATDPVAAAAIAAGGAQACDVLSAKGLRHRLPLADLPAADRRKRGEKLVDFGPDDVTMAVVTL